MAAPSKSPSRHDRERLDAAWNAFIKVVDEFGYTISVEEFGDTFDIDIWTGPSSEDASNYLYTIYSAEH